MVNGPTYIKTFLKKKIYFVPIRNECIIEIHQNLLKLLNQAETPRYLNRYVSKNGTLFSIISTIRYEIHNIIVYTNIKYSISIFQNHYMTRPNFSLKISSTSFLHFFFSFEICRFMFQKGIYILFS